MAIDVKGFAPIYPGIFRMIAIDQYGMFILLPGKNPRRELMKALQRKHAEKLLQNSTGTHVGYRIANRDFELHSIVPLDMGKWKPEPAPKKPRPKKGEPGFKSRSKKAVAEGLLPVEGQEIKVGDKISSPGHEIDGNTILAVGKGQS